MKANQIAVHNFMILKKPKLLHLYLKSVLPFYDLSKVISSIYNTRGITGLPTANEPKSALK